MTSQRGQWSSQLGFVLAAAGSAVGLGNVWGFPMMTARNGGAAFVLVYLFVIFLICYPVVLTEIAIGRATSRNPVGAFKTLAPGSPWKYAGLLGVLCGFMILSFYIVIAGWVFGYFLETLFGGLNRLAGEGEFGRFVANPWKNLLYMLVFMTATLGIVVGGVKDGIERWSRYLMPTLVLMLFALIIYVLTLDNATKGLAFYLVPDFSKLEMSTITTATSQAFFSLSLGMGALITYGSYVAKRENIVISGLIVTVFDTFIAFSAGLLVIPAVFTNPNLDINHVSQGPGLLFVALPQVFQYLANDVGYFFASFLAAFFFLLICFAALTSTISLLEVPTSYIVDERGHQRKRAALGAAAFITFLALFSLLANGGSQTLTNFVTYPSGMTKDFLSLVADIFFETALPLGGFLITTFAAYRWKAYNLKQELEIGFPGFTGTIAEKFIGVMIYVCPIVLLFIFINQVLVTYFGSSLLQLFS